MKEIAEFAKAVLQAHWHANEQELGFLSLSYKTICTLVPQCHPKERIETVTRHPFDLSKTFHGEGRHHMRQLQLGKHDVSTTSPNTTVQTEPKAKVPNAF